MTKILNRFGIEYFPRDTEALARDINLLVSMGWEREKHQPDYDQILGGVMYSRGDKSFVLATHAVKDSLLLEQPALTEKSFDNDGNFLQRSLDEVLSF